MMEEEFRSIRIEKEICHGCMSCMRICPTHAIRVHSNKASLIKELCIDCGECVRTCEYKAILPLTSSFSEFSKFKYTIALPSPVFYSQFGKEIQPGILLEALKKIGFDDAYDVACSSEAVSIALQEYLDSNEGPRPLISPYCPTILRLIQVRYPNLLENLIPIESPMEIAAREAKRKKMQELGLSEKEIGAIYITPCPAKMISILSPPRKKHSFLDGTIAISEIYPSILQAIPQITTKNDVKEVRGLGLGWPIVGGQVASLKAEECIAIGGINDCIRILEDIENGKLRDIQYIECHSCPNACVGGSLTIENQYIARGKVLKIVEKYGSQPCQEREYIRELYRRNFFSQLGKISASPIKPLDDDISKAIQKMKQKQKILDMLPKIDCGICGAPTCETFADDVIKGLTCADECIILTVKKFESMSGNLFETAQKHSRKIKSRWEDEKK
ncbi:MAG: ferredoxin [Ignavibacteria bacterium]|nr:ferredoxin [Ignavibacteria bacterium]